MKFAIIRSSPSSYPDIPAPRPTKIWKLANSSNITIIFHFEPDFYTCSLHDRKVMSHFSWKNDPKMPFFTIFLMTRKNFLGSHWNILTNETVLERLLNFWIFGTYFTMIAHLVKIREPPKVKKSKNRVTRKPDLETQNWVCSFSSFIGLYQTRIVTVQMLFDNNFRFFLNFCLENLGAKNWVFYWLLSLWTF